MIKRILRFTTEAVNQYRALEKEQSLKGLLAQVRKTLSFLETNLKHPSLQTHEYNSLFGVHGERVWEAYVQNNTPSAYRIFWHYGPDLMKEGRRIPVITIIAITAHP